MPTLAKIIFVLALALSFSGRISPPIALTMGILFGLSFAHPYLSESRGIARTLLQISVVALGFGMNLNEVLKAGSSGFLYTALGISFALIGGTLLGKFLQVRGNSSFLITTGTAICGGSAIAAIAPVLQANEEEMAVSLGTVFILNSIALLIFRLSEARCIFRRRNLVCGRRWRFMIRVRLLGQPRNTGRKPWLWERP
jgi:uncharacterized membrane protein YadS